ncbi:MAG: deoxyribose-phosphate aldolase [Candidatus Thermoplasmatota archaeon]|nr:deoxyribose-phosphate aldolase [Candidatus Thermoplasmatota archaeon]
MLTKKQLARMIDHTNLKPFATSEDIKKLCSEAKKYDFATVCVNPYWVSLVSELLLGTDIKVCTVVGFPLGANTLEVKLFEAKDACRNGSQEIDVVMNIGALKDKNYELVKREIFKIAEEVGKVPVKVIIECCYLSEEEKVKACELAKEAGARFVKTSTGFGVSGANVEDVALIRRVVGENFGIKAAGGIKTAEQALKLIEAGATRIGASASVEIIEGLKE